MNFKCIIIEDEPLAADILKEYIGKIPYLEVKAVFKDALSALSFLKSEPIDLIFLDIHLPGIKGLEFLRSLKNPPNVILTTAYHEYAVESYELNVLDYLLKPFGFDRFLQAIQKLPSENQIQPDIPKEKEEKYLLINHQNRKKRIAIENINYVESAKEYVIIYENGEPIKTKMNITSVEEKLNGFGFIRSHRSFLVALKAIQSYNQSYLQVENKNIPIGKYYKQQFLTAVEAGSI